MLEIEENELCVVCNKPGLTFYNQKSRIKHCKKSITDDTKVSGKAPVSTTDQETALLLPQLRRVFLLQQIFKQCVQDDTTLLEALLQELGDPCDWFEICNGCTELIDSGINVLRKLRRYQEEHKRLVETLEKKLSESYCGQPWTTGSRCILVRNEGEEKSRKRLDFRNKIRKIESSLYCCDLDLKPVVENVTENADDLTYFDIDFENPSILATPDDFTENMNDKDQIKANCQPTLTRLRPRSMSRKRTFIHKDSDSEDDFSPFNNDGEPEDPDFSVSDDAERDKVHDLKSEPVKREKPIRTGEINQQRNKQQPFAPKPKQSRFCEICNKTLRLKSSTAFKFHMFKQHNQGEPDVKFPMCSECGQLFSCKSTLEIHMAKRHPVETEGEEAKFFCDQCGKGFRLEMSLKAHLKSVHEETSVICRVCGIQYRNSITLRLHIRGKHRETLKMSEAEVDEYVKRQNEKKPFRCKLCSERFAFSVLLYYHQRNSHPEVTEKYKCDICGKGFSRPSNLKIHNEAHHMDSKMSWTCEDCGKVFALKVRLHQHRTRYCAVGKQKKLLHIRNLETDDADSSAISETLNKSHHRAQSLQDHEEPSKVDYENGVPLEEIANMNLLKAPPQTTKHTLELHDSDSDQDSGPSNNDDEPEDSDFSRREKRKRKNPERFCKFCNKTLICGSVQFRFHLYKLHNQGEPDERFSMCSECGELFPYKSRLTYHMNMQHPEKTENAGEDKFFCELCGKGFKLELRLKIHLKRVHHEELAICQFCGNQYKNSTLLGFHIRGIHPETLKMSASELEEYVRNQDKLNPFLCKLCVERFPSRVLLNLHRRTNHPDLKGKYKCDICGKGFSRKTTVKEHMEAYHTDSETSCEDCGKTFKSKLRLSQHRRRHCEVIQQKSLLTSSSQD